MSATETLRNLRFILGHAFTLDKLRLRIAEIEEDSDTYDEPVASTARRVSFQSHRAPVSQQPVGRRRSPPPDQLAHLSDTDSDENQLDDDDDEEGDLSLQRFESAAAQPPRMIDDDSSSDEDENLEPKSPPPLSNEELEALTGGPGDDALTSSYSDLRGCPCHGEKDHVPAASQVWEVPRKDGYHGPRLAVVQVEA